MEKQYLDYNGLANVAGYVNTRLKTVTTMPVSADNGAVRLYVGTSGSTYQQGHIYQYNSENTEWVDITPIGSGGEYRLLTGTLLANAWSNNTQTVTIQGISSTTNGVIGLLDSATSTQIESAKSSEINVTSLGTNSVSFVCKNVPTVDIPFGVLIGGGGTDVEANPSGTATGILTKLGIGSDIYEIQTVESDITFTLYSATEDTVTISQNGTTVKTVTIASGNSAEVTLPKGKYTFTSSIAKNPDDLSAFYSKEVDITLVVIDVYLMPDNVCYWYGYKSSEYEIISAANGYTWGSYSYTFITPTESTNKITCNAPAGSQACGIAFKNAITGSTAKAIVQGISNYSGSIYGALYLNNTKSIIIDNAIASNTIENTSIHLKTLNISGNASKILVLDVYNTRKIDVYALWYDASEIDVSTKANKTDIAPVENGTTASRAYSIGQQFYLNGSLYKAKASIASGATFTIGTNCELADCITEQIGKSWKYLGRSTGLWSSLPKINVPEGINQYKEFLIVFATDVSVAVNTIQRLVQYVPYELLSGKFGVAVEYINPSYTINITTQIANNTNFNCGYTLRNGTMPSDFAISIYGR